jgi:hypothetical protein
MNRLNRFHQHHHDSIAFGYSCFDRMILKGYMRSFQHTKCGGVIHWFLRNHRQAPEVNRAYFAKIASTYRDWVNQYAYQAGIDILEPEKNIRQEDLVAPYFQQLGTRPGVAAIVRTRQLERVAWYYARSKHIAVDCHSVYLYYFYLNDPCCGHMFVRICPHFPFHIRVWLNGHNWLACQLQREGIAYQKRDNLFVACAQPQRLQELSDAFAPADITAAVERWVAHLLPFFSEAERQEGYRHQLYMAEMEYCQNLIFHKRAAVDRLFDRLMDANRGMGHPDKLAIVFGRAHFQPNLRTGEIVLKMTTLRTPVLSSRYHKTSIKQYVSNGLGLRTESTSFDLKDLCLPKNIKNLPRLRQVLDTANLAT